MYQEQEKHFIRSNSKYTEVYLTFLLVHVLTITRLQNKIRIAYEIANISQILEFKCMYISISIIFQNSAHFALRWYHTLQVKFDLLV